MNVGSSRRVRVGLVALFLGFAACTPAPHRIAKAHDPEHAVFLVSQVQSNGHYKAIAHPETLTLTKEDFESAKVVVLWGYRHKSTTIKFTKPDIPTPACDDKAGTCSVEVPKNIANGKYKYTITGKHDDTNDLDPNDPDIEVDR